MYSSITGPSSCAMTLANAADFLLSIDARLKALDVERSRLLALRELYAGDDSPPPPAQMGAVSITGLPPVPEPERTRLIMNKVGQTGLTPLILRVVAKHPGLPNAVIVKRIQDYIHPDTQVARPNIRKTIRFLIETKRLAKDVAGNIHVPKSREIPLGLDGE